MVTDSEVSQSVKKIQSYCDERFDTMLWPCDDCRIRLLCGRRVDEWPKPQKEGESE